MSFVADLTTLISASVDGRLACPEDWPRVPLGSIARIVNGFPFPSSGFGAVGTPVIRIRDVAGGATNTRYQGPIPEGYWVEPGDLIVGMDGDFASAFWRTDRALLNQRVCRLLPDPQKLDLGFLRYVLPAYLELINENTPSVTVKHLSSRTLAALPIPLPALNVQKELAARIDDLFTEIDDGEAALARARSDLSTWRKALLKAAVTGELTVDWRAANPPTETGAALLARILADRRTRWLADPRNKTKRYVEPAGPDTNALPLLPDDWTWATAGQVVRQTEYGTSTKCNEVPVGPPVLRMGNIQDGGIDWRKLKYAPVDEQLPLLKIGDVLFNRTNSAELLGKSAVFDGADDPVSFASYLVAVRLSIVNPHYFSAWMNSIFGRQWVSENKSQQVGQANLSAGTLMRMPLPVPPLAEQDRIVEHVSQSRQGDDELLAEIIGHQTASTTLRQSILAAAFRGDFVA